MWPSAPAELPDEDGEGAAGRCEVHVASGGSLPAGDAFRPPTQLGLLERFHKTLKQEEVYWRPYDNPGHARECLQEFRQRYNGTTALGLGAGDGRRSFGTRRGPHERNGDSDSEVARLGGRSREEVK